LAGDQVARGYWNKPELTAQIFGARLCGDEADGLSYLRTGDLGFLSGGQVFVTGRLKDLIILSGQNIYPHDVEEATSNSHRALRPDAAAAFSTEDDHGERLVVIQEADLRNHDVDEIF